MVFAWWAAAVSRQSQQPARPRTELSTLSFPPYTPGPVVLFGSGETSPSGRKIFDSLFRRLPETPRVMLLETPAGFELNSPRVAGRIAGFLEERLQNYRPQTRVIAARKRGTPFSPDNPDIVAPLLQADLLFMGPGSPTYAVRQLHDSLAWHMLVARQRLGAALVLASAAAIAASTYVLPVYEIYKAGADLHWLPGLDLFGAYGLGLVFIPHWNNNDGGGELDTSRCFMGQERFACLMEMLPPELTVIGIDEKSALTIDLAAGQCQVAGLGGVTLLHTGHHHPAGLPGQELVGAGLAEIAQRRRGHVHLYLPGQTFPIQHLGPFRLPDLAAGLPAQVWEQALQAHASRAAGLPPNLPLPPAAAPGAVHELLQARQVARQRKDWPAADALRGQIAALGWRVLDTPDGQKLEKI